MGEHEGMLARDGIQKCLTVQKKDALLKIREPQDGHMITSFIFYNVLLVCQRGAMGESRLLGTKTNRVVLGPISSSFPVFFFKVIRRSLRKSRER